MAQPLLDPVLNLKVKTVSKNDKKMVKAFLSRVGQSACRIVAEATFSPEHSVASAVKDLRSQITKRYTNEPGIKYFCVSSRLINMYSLKTLQLMMMMLMITN